jgi:hypothetical protein
MRGSKGAVHGRQRLPGRDGSELLYPSPNTKRPTSPQRGGSGGLSLFPDFERPGLNTDHQPRARGGLLLYLDSMSLVAADPARSGAFMQGSLSSA